MNNVNREREKKSERETWKERKTKRERDMTQRATQREGE